jgi:glycosidase
MRASFGVLVGLSCVLPAVVGCGDDDGGFIVDASVPDGSMRPPPYRPPRCGGDGGVGGDASCGEGGVPPIEEDAGPPPPPPPPCNEITFEYVNAGATTVWLSGTFTSWAATPAGGALEMEREGDTWTLTTLIEPIQQHQYKFIVDGTTWIPDPNNPNRVDDGFGSFNSVLDVCSAACGELDEFDWRDTFMYFVMVDRFRDSDGMASPVAGATDGDATRGPSGQYEGGDLRGITQEMDYLADLGVTALWITAPFENRNTSGAAINPASDPNVYSAFHGYWPSPANINYSDPDNPSPRPLVESRIGNEADLRAMITAAHSATSANGDGIKVLFDYVMNHVDDSSGLYSAHRDWFVSPLRQCGPDNLWDDPVWSTRCSFTSYLPAFDFEVPAAREWSVNDAVWWAKEFGIDGYRLDAIKHVPLSWLTELRARLNAEITDAPADRFYLVGETFAYDDRDLLRRYVDPETMLDGQFDFPFKARLCEALFTPSGNLGAFSTWMDGNDGFYGAGSIMTTWIGNHDIPRPIHFASREITNCREGSNPDNGWNWRPAQPTAREPYERLGVAYAVMFTNPGIPLMYYGDEIGLAGGGDPDNRRMMPWTEGSLNEHQRALREKVRALGRIRGAYPVLGRGRRVTVSSDADTWVYRMTGCGDDDVLVAINKADAARTVSIPAGSYEDLVDGGAVSGGSRELPARSFVILGTAP